MKCHECGTENNFEWATFCRNCNQPLRREDSGSAAQGSMNQDPVRESNPSSNEQTALLNESDKIDIGIADPLDFVMGARKGDPESPSMEIAEQISPEPIESELTLYRDDAVRLSVSEHADNQKVIIESVKSGFKVAADGEDNVEITENYDDYESDRMTETADQLNKSDQLPQPETYADPPEPVVQKQESQEMEIPAPPSTKSDIETERPAPPANLNDVTHSKGVIYLAGKSLKLTGGLKVVPGDEITINDKPFQVKLEKKNNRGLILLIAGGALALFVALLIMTGFLSKDIGQLAGIVTDGITGRPLPGITVRLSEINKSVKTNEAGFFAFDQIPSGIHSIEFKAPDGNNVKDKVTVIKGQTSTVALATSVVSQSVAAPQAAVAKPRPSVEKEPQASASDKGFMKLTIDPNNSSVYLDGKPIGVGSNTYKVPAGQHDLTIRKDGYSDHRQNVRIEPDKTHNVKVSLIQSEQSSRPDKKTTTEMALEMESAGNFKEAARLYDQALKTSPRDLKAILGKARCAREEGLFEEATSRFQQAAKIASDKGDTRAQIEALTGVIEIRPNTFNAYSSRGDVLYSLGQYQKAADDFAKVIELDKRNLGAYYKLGNSYYVLGQYDDALGAFKAAEETNFADPKAQVCLAKTYLALGDKRNTKRSYERFKELASYSARVEFKKDRDWQKVLAALGEKD